MEYITDNMQKYANYKEQMGRLKKAMASQFYLEAIAIEYAVIEDRVESVLRHGGTFNPEKHNTLNKKLNRLSEMQRNKKGLVRKHISEELIQSIYNWKNERNPMTHTLLKLDLCTEDMRAIAQEGQRIVKNLNSKVSSYNRAMDKET